MASLLSLLLILVSLTSISAIYFDINTCTETTPCIFVTPTGKDINNGSSTSPLRTIQKALSILNATATLPTTIVLADGSYPGNVQWTGKDLSLTSINGPSSTFIDCNRIPNQRGLWLGSGETSTTTISGVTIRNCRNTMGAAMAIVGENTRPLIRDMVLHNSSSTMGGGMLVFFASPSLINVTFTANQARDGAGLMVVHNATMLVAQQYQAMALALNYVVDETKPLPLGFTSSLSITSCTFDGNVAAGLGAAAYLLAAYRVTFTRMTAINGQATGSGAIAAGTRSSLSIVDSTFMDNKAMVAAGGAVSIQQGSMATILRSNFQRNQAKQAGGAIAVGTTAMATITGCTMNANQATTASIVMVDATARAAITGCTMTNNIATGSGGLLYLNPMAAMNANMSTNTFSGNQASYGADYGSFASSLVFVLSNDTILGESTTSPAVLPTQTSTNLQLSINNLDTITLRLMLIDTFGQRYDLNSSNQTDLYADIKTLDNNTIPALLVASTRVQMPQGIADVSVVLVGELEATYAVQWSVDIPTVAPISLLVSILPCEPQSVTTYYDSTTFPICHPANTHHISSSLFTGIVVISGILIICVLLVQGLIIWFWSTPVFKTSTPLFMSLMLVGAIVGYLSTILSVIDIDRTSRGLALFDQICKTQYWMMSIAFVLMFGTLALKTWRIRNIFCNETLTEIRTVSTWALLRWLVALVAIEVLIHVIWISYDPLHATMILNGQTLGATCSSKHETAFLVANLVYKGAIALVCVIFAYQTRDVTSRFNESRQLMIASYNMFVCVIVIAALSLALPDIDARRTVYAVGALFIITSTWFVLCTPKLFVAMFRSEQNISLGAPTGSGGKNSNSGGKNSHTDDGSRRMSMGKSSYQLQHSKTSGANTPTRSKAGSNANTAPASPMIASHKLSLNLGQRSSVSHAPSNMTSPTFHIPGSPQMNTMNIPRHLSIATGTPQPATSMDDIDIPALDLSTLNGQGARRASQPTLYDSSNTPSVHGSGKFTPVAAKNFI